VIVVLGLHQTKALPIRLFYADKRFHGMPPGAESVRAFLIGSAFSLGWTPCVGPILAVVLTFAAAESRVRGIWLLAAYAMGLALPFLLIAFSVEGFLSFYTRFQSHLRKLEIGSGLTMIAIGLLVFTGHLVLLNEWLNSIPLFRWMAEKFL